MLNNKSPTKQEPKKEPYFFFPHLVMCGLLLIAICVTSYVAIERINETNRLLSTFHRIDTVKDEEEYPVEVHVNCQSKEGDQDHLMAASLAVVDHVWPVKIHGNCLVHGLSMSGQLINKELSDCQKRQENGENVGCAGIYHYQKTDPQSDPNLCKGDPGCRSFRTELGAECPPRWEESTNCSGPECVKTCVLFSRDQDQQEDPNLCTHWKSDCHDSMPGSCAVTCDIPKGDE